MAAEKGSYSAGRLGDTVNDLNVEYSLSTRLAKEALQLHSYIQVDMAHTVMLAEQGVLDRTQAGPILGALRDVEGLGPGELPLDPRKGSLLLQVEAFMEERIGDDIAGRMHTGRSRNDQHEAANRIHMRDGLLNVVEATLRLQDEMLDLADEHHDSLMPGYTHLQHAQPTTLGHYFMRHFYPFERSQQRLEGAFDRTNLSSLGGAACSGTTWPLDRRRAAHLLGHGDIVMNSADAGVFTRDHPQESAAVLSILVNDVGRLAGDFYVWSTWEFGLVEVADEMADTSSIMPQKKNPDAIERIRGLSGVAVGWLSQVLGAQRSASSSDLELVFAPDPALEMIDPTLAVVELMRESLITSAYRTDIMSQRAEVNWTTATNLADNLVRYAGIPFRSAHHVVGRLVRNAVAQGVGPSEVTATMVDAAAKEAIGRSVGLSEELVRESLDARAFIEALVTEGSANPASVRDMVVDGRRLQAQHRTWYQETSQRLQAARVELDAAVDSYFVEVE